MASEHPAHSFYHRHKQLILYSIGLLVILVIAFGAMAYSFSARVSAAEQDYNQKISALGQQTTQALEQAKGVLEAQLASLNESLTGVGTQLQSFKDQNTREINTLNSLIDSIESQTSIQLGELKTEIKNVQIKSADFSGIIEDVLKSVVSVKTNTGQGSGAIITDDGYVVTNFHVINGASESSIRAHTYGGSTYAAKVAGVDESADIAVLKIDGSFQPLEFGDYKGAKVGEKVIALGNPAGLDFTVTEGIISAFRTASNGKVYLQIDVPINPGNSGGPLVNVHSEILGINNFKLQGDFEGLGFAINSNTVEGITDRLIAEHRAAQQAAP